MAAGPQLASKIVSAGVFQDRGGSARADDEGLVMLTVEGEAVLMRVFVGETHQWERRPLYVALLDLFHRKGLAGATVLRAVAGFGPTSILHTAGILKLSADLPIVIEVVDTQEHLDAVLPEVDRMMSGGLVTMEKVRVIRYV
jgi:PII-like signaling protein